MANGNKLQQIKNKTYFFYILMHIYTNNQVPEV